MDDNATDRELLLLFSRQGNEAAFAELVKRYAGLVFGVVLRRTDDYGAAEETTQNVFAILARKAAALTGHPALAGWLQKTAAYEAARAAQKETTRRRYMSAYQEEPREQPEPAPEETSAARWQAALPLLDTVVAALPEPDRAVLVLRYWQSQPFKRIAALLGSSAAACEKRAARALEKLSRGLRSRGVVMGTAALGVGLTPALTKAAVTPAVLSRLAPAALAAAKTAPAAAPWISFFVMKSKLSLTAAGLAVALLCGGGGWLAGRSRAAAVSQKGSTASHPEADTADRAVAGAVRTRPAADTAMAARRQQLRALLEAARRDLLIASFDPVAKARAAARVAAIDPADVKAALDLAAAMAGGEDYSLSLMPLLLEHWAATDGQAACEYALTRVKAARMSLPPVSDPLRAWASRDPRAAFAWYRGSAGKQEKTAPDAEGWMPVSSIRWIMGAWVLQDAPAAVEAFLTLKDKREIDGAMTGFSEMSAGAASRTPVLDAFLKLRRGEHEGNALSDLSQLLKRWSVERAADLAGWLDGQEVPKSYHGGMGKAILSGWLREDPAAATAWWLQAPGGYPDRAGRMEDIVSAWSETDVFAAAEWLAAQPLDKDAARAMTTLAGKVASSDPVRGWEWAQHIPDSFHRGDAMKQVVSAWARQDKGAAEEAVRLADVEEAVRSNLQQAIRQSAP